MFDIIYKDIKTGCVLCTIKNTFTVLRDGETVYVDGKQWNIVKSFYEPSLIGLSNNTYIVWLSLIGKGDDENKTEAQSDLTSDSQITKKKIKYVNYVIVIAVIMIIVLLMSLCTKVVKDEKYIDNTINQVHKTVNYVNSICDILYKD